MIFTRPISPFGIVTSQSWREVAAYFEMIERFGIAKFIELGVHEGGLAALMISRAMFVEGFSYVGVQRDPTVQNVVVRRADIIWGDCFTQPIINQVSLAIRDTNGPVLLLCDNGNKVHEVQVYAPQLRPGDYLTVHDYGTEIQAEDLMILEQTGRYQEIEPGLWRGQSRLPLYQKVY